MSPYGSPHLRALGAALPAGLQRFHTEAQTRPVSGQARVTTGGVFGRVLLRLLGLHLREGSHVSPYAECDVGAVFNPCGISENAEEYDLIGLSDILVG